MDVFCPACHGPSRMEASARAAQCAECGTQLLLGGRYLLTAAPPPGSAADEVDGVAPLRAGWDVNTLQAVCIRVGSPGRPERLAREAAVLRGLRVDGVPRVLAHLDVEGVGPVLVLTRPGGHLLETQLAQGLRTDGRGARALLEGLLGVLVELERLSPPVRHRNLHPGSIFWDGWGRVSLWDFARATDTLADQSQDRVVGRAGYVPPADASAEDGELYAVGATVVHLLSRRPPAELQRPDGTLDFRAAVHVEPELLDYLDRLVCRGRKRFGSAAAALQALRLLELGQSPGATQVAAWGLAGAAAAVVFSAGVGFLAFAAVPAAAPRFRAAEAPASPRRPVVMSVQSSPSGALVQLDGEILGHTPLSRLVAPRALARLEVSMPGFDTAVHNVRLTDHSVTRLVLSPERPTEHPGAARDQAVAELTRELHLRRPALLACNRLGTERLRLHLDLDEDGTLREVAPRGARSRAAATCLQRSLRGMRLAEAPGVQADVDISYSPAFWVMAY